MIYYSMRIKFVVAQAEAAAVEACYIIEEVAKELWQVCG
jgi:hypothetical protein